MLTIVNKKLFRKDKSSCRCFTLIELLIVIAIIGILASILLPSLQKARREAYRAVCMSNQKQMGATVQLYANDSNDYLFVLQTEASGKRIHYKRQMFPYIHDETLDNSSLDLRMTQGVFKCPSAQKDAEYADFRRGGIVWNAKAGERLISDDSTEKPKKIDAMNVPTETILMGVASDDVTEFWYLTLTHHWNLTGGVEWVSQRHSNGLNVLWGDMHVSWNSQKSIKYGKDGINSYWHDFIK